jgi:hypothetical protein
MPNFLEEWIQNPVKKCHSALVIWKSIILEFSLIGNYIVWKVGKADKVQLVLCPWIVIQGSHRLTTHMIHDITGRQLHTLRIIARRNIDISQP